MSAQLAACFRLRNYFRPGMLVDGGLECISYPFPADRGGIAIMVRTKDDPTTMREVGIVESDYV